MYKEAAILNSVNLLRIFIFDLRDMPRLISYGVQIHFIHAFLRCQCTRYIHLIKNMKQRFRFVMLFKGWVSNEYIGLKKYYLVAIIYYAATNSVTIF
jgi:hypothetical protein